MKKIAVLTSGGDAPGMNAAIRAVVRAGIYEGMDVYGVERGYNGLIEDRMTPMNLRSVADIVHRGGTILKTARCEAFKTQEGQEKALETLRGRQIDGVVVIGGDGSYRGAEALGKHGIPTMAIPGTIDNDLAYTDYTIGFDTACNTVLDAVNKIRDTMTSHDRVSVVEVMGRNCGDIALYSGLGGGAEVVVVPEMPTGIEEAVARLERSKRHGKMSCIVLLAEGAGNAHDFSKALQEATGMEVRSTVLGHIQRGGNPTMFDRILATRMGAHAVALLKKGMRNRAIGIVNNQIKDFDITEALKCKARFNLELYNLVNIMAR